MVSSLNCDRDHSAFAIAGYRFGAGDVSRRGPAGAARAHRRTQVSASNTDTEASVRNIEAEASVSRVEAEAFARRSDVECHGEHRRRRMV